MTPFIQRLALWWMLCLCLCLWPAAVQAHNWPAVSVGESQLRLATEQEARAVLMAEDDWTRAAGDFHRRATLGVAHPVSQAALRAGLSDAAQAWPDAQAQRWHTALQAIAARLHALRLPLPPEVLLASTKGWDAAGALYTRSNVVFIPSDVQLDYSDEEILAHELFHIASRYHPQWADRIYALFGFDATGELQWPQEWQALRIANPDAPHHRHAITLPQPDGSTQAYMPLLVARRDTLAEGESFFDVTDLRLLAVTPGPVTRPLRRNGQLLWHNAARHAAYVQRLGGNTSYIIHPEEVAADHFAFVLSGRPVPNPDLLERLARAIPLPPSQVPGNAPP